MGYLFSSFILGKTMENTRNRRDIKLRDKWNGRYGIKNLIASPLFKKRTVFSEDLVAVELDKTETLMNKPIAIGCAVLDISKVLMYEFHYDRMKREYGDDCTLCYTDTDSFIYLFTNVNNIYDDMKKNMHLYDTSDYAPDNEHGMMRINKKVPGLMKDENNGACMSEFVGLRSKMYAVRVQGRDRMLKAKGIKSYVLKKDLSFDHYLECIRNNTVTYHQQNSIRSNAHRVYTITQRKLTLNPHDDKRFIENDNINTLPWGHYNINI